MSDSYQLVQLKNETWSVRSLAEGETFHPVVGPVAEAEELYVRQLRLEERLPVHLDEEWVVWDVGLGAAANILSVLKALRGRHPRVRVMSFDHTLEPLRFALSHADRLGYFEGFEPWVRSLLDQGQLRLDLPDFSLDWAVVESDFPKALASPAAANWPAPHAILFDAFSPARNPIMWSLPLFTRLQACTRPDRPCLLPTYSRATLLRVTLLLAGWYVGVGQATGEKEETTIASNVPELIRQPLDRAWLQRARRSTSAEPIHDGVYRQQPLSESSWTRLLAHAQFR